MKTLTFFLSPLSLSHPSLCFCHSFLLSSRNFSIYECLRFLHIIAMECFLSSILSCCSFLLLLLCPFDFIFIFLPPSLLSHSLSFILLLSLILSLSLPLSSKEITPCQTNKIWSKYSDSRPSLLDYIITCLQRHFIFKMPTSELEKFSLLFLLGQSKTDILSPKLLFIFYYSIFQKYLVAQW